MREIRFDELGFEIPRALVMAGAPLGVAEIRRRLGLPLGGHDLGWFVGADGARWRVRLARVDDPAQPTERMWVTLIPSPPPR